MELKIKTAKRWLRANYGKQDYEWLVGFRADEERRVKGYQKRVQYIHPVFPLYEQGVTKDEVNNYWAKKSYNLEIPAILGNCTLCFLKGKNAIISILQNYPELAKEWIEDEELSKQLGKGHTYLTGITYKEMLNIAQNKKLSKTDISLVQPAFNCSCTN